MKKNIIIVAMAAATALFFAASCAKQETEGTQIPSEGRTFSAVIEQNLTKTTLTSELKVHWQNGDRISINGFEYVATAKIPATKALFSPVGEEVPENEKYLAFFPSSISNSWLPQTQTYVPGAFNSPMYAQSETTELSFRNLCGVLHFAVKGDDKVRAITIKANENLWGSFVISEDGSAELCGGGDSTITLDCGENGVQLNPDYATDFYISLPARTYSAGMKINVIGTDSKELSVTKTTVKNITIARNTVYDLEWNFEPTVNETLAKFFKGLSEDQAKLAAATDEATREMTDEQKKYTQEHPEEFFLPEIHTWENALAAIKAIDKDLNRLPNEKLSEDQRRQKEGELHFFRALLYFELFRTYGIAPTLADGYQTPRPLKEVFDEIEKGAKVSADLLSSSYEETYRIIALDEGVEVTRPSKWAAKALMARASLYAASPLFSGIDGTINTCINYCLEIYNSGEYELLTEYLNLWGENAFNNKELIFGVRLAPNDAYSGIYSTEHLYKNFTSADTRLGSTIEKSDKYYIKKPVNLIMPIFRLADILITLAEAHFNSTDYQSALEMINRLRSRAGLQNIEITQLKTEDIETEIRNERMKELAFEGHRFWDVRRWGKAGEYFGTIEGVQRTWDKSYNFYPEPQE